MLARHTNKQDTETLGVRIAELSGPLERVCTQQSQAHQGGPHSLWVGIDDGSIDEGLMDGWMDDGSMDDGWMDDRWMDGRRIDGLMNDQWMMDGWIKEGWMDG